MQIQLIWKVSFWNQSIYFKSIKYDTVHGYENRGSVGLCPKINPYVGVGQARSGSVGLVGDA